MLQLVLLRLLSLVVSKTRIVCKTVGVSNDIMYCTPLVVAAESLVSFLLLLDIVEV